MAKRKNNIDDIDINDDFELEDIDDFDPFDVLDDSYEDKKSYGNDKPRGGNASDKRNKNGTPFIIHHASPVQRAYEEDILEVKTDIIGHYRIS